MRCLTLFLAGLVAGCAPGRASLDPRRAIPPGEEIVLARSEFSAGRSALLLTRPTVPTRGPTGEPALEVTFVVRTPAAPSLARFESRVFADLDGDGEPGPGEIVSSSSNREAPGARGRVHRLLLVLPKSPQAARLQFAARAELTDGTVLERNGQLQGLP